MNQKISLVLSGGGARGAYQVGVLKAVSEILKTSNGEGSPFKILSGSSAGAINTAKLATGSKNFSIAADELVQLWSNIKSDQVYKTDLLSLNKFGLGALLSSSKKFNALLDTTPLKKLIEDNCDFSRIQNNLEAGIYDSVIITANNYSTNTATSFIQSAARVNQELMFWKESRRKAIHAEIKAEHIMASSAIPVLFPPINIQGQPHGDGCVRNNTPCSPSLRMGADKLFVIGVRTQTSSEANPNNQLNIEQKPHSEASMVRIFNTLLNAVLLDSVEQDVQRIQRINDLVDEVKKLDPQFESKKLKKIPALCISPSLDIGEIARQKAHHMPRILRLSINAFGQLDEASEILSYLLFDNEFCRNLIEIGYNDALKQKTDIERFFNE